MVARHLVFACFQKLSDHRASKIVWAACLALLAHQSCFAQRAPGAIGIGGQIGEPSGLSVQLYQPRTVSYDFLAAWNLDDFLYLNVHGLLEKDLNGTNELHFFYGPGAFIGFRDHPRKGHDDDVEAGISATFGLGIDVQDFEIYARVTPRLSLMPGTDGDVGGGIGIRYFF